MPLHQVSSGQLDPIRIRAAPIRSSTILSILINPLKISRIFSARWTPNATLTMYKQFEHCTTYGSTESANESGPNRSTEIPADDFQTFFGQMDTECDVDRVETVLSIARFLDPPNRVRIDRQDHLLTILTFFSPR